MTDTSSIGPSWPPAKTSHRRIKGIYTGGVISGEAWLNAFVDELEEWTPDLDGAASDRLSVRAVVERRLIDEHVGRLKPWVEAALPIDDERCLVYFGHNLPSRASESDDLERSLEHVAIARAEGPRPCSQIKHRVLEVGYELRILEHRERVGDPAVLEGIADLYRRFGWNLEETRDLLASEACEIAVATTPDGPSGSPSIVCAGIAETSHIRFKDGSELRVAEFTEAATRRDHQGRGLYSAVAATLMVELARRSKRSQISGGELDLGFGECSGHDIGVLIAARRLGRSFSSSYIRQQSWPFQGFLSQHVPIAGSARNTPYNDLFPTYIGRQDLYRMTGVE